AGSEGSRASVTNSRSVPDNGRPCGGHRTATMKPFTALLGAAAGTHAADQLALATLPLTASLVLGVGPDILGLLVAAQSAAWLLARHLPPTWGYGLAALGAAPALACILALPKAAAPLAGAERPSLVAAIQAGARFVIRHELLRGISLCAIFWNFAFFALLAVW